MGKKNTIKNKAFKKGKTKRAFTLIELLAVILILGIIALIAGSTIYNMVEHSRKEAYKATVRGVLKSAEHYVTSYPLLNRGKPKYPIVFTCDGKECSNGIDKLELEGKLPVSGQVIIEDSSNIKARYLRSDRYCAFGDKVNIEINKDCDNVDITSPTNPTKGELGPTEGNNPEGKIKELASGSTDDHSEVTYLYLVLNDPEEPSKNDKRFSKDTTYKRACGRDYYGWALAEDASGNRSDVYYLGEAHDGENVYSEWSECTKECDGGVKTRTNTCSLITENLSEECNTQSCVVDVGTCSITGKLTGGVWKNYTAECIKEIDVTNLSVIEITGTSSMALNKHCHSYSTSGRGSSIIYVDLLNNNGGKIKSNEYAYMTFNPGDFDSIYAKKTPVTINSSFDVSNITGTVKIRLYHYTGGIYCSSSNNNDVQLTGKGSITITAK